MKQKLIGVILASSMMSGVAYAGCGMPGCTADSKDAGLSSTPSQIQVDLVKDKLEKMGLKSETHALKQIPGLIEVDGPRGITYFTDSTARYLIAGHLLDPVARKDLTKERQEKAKIGLLKKAINARHLVLGGDKQAKNAIVVFDDPDCPYCRKLETQLGANSGVKAYHVMTPLAQLHPQAEEHTKAILCSKDMNSTLEAIMLGGQSPSTEKCANPQYAQMRAEHASLANTYGVNSTPTLVRLTDGQVWSGYMPITQLRQWAAGKEISAAAVNAAIQAGQ